MSVNVNYQIYSHVPAFTHLVNPIGNLDYLSNYVTFYSPHTGVSAIKGAAVPVSLSPAH